MRSEFGSATTSNNGISSVVEPDSYETDNRSGPSRLPYHGRQLAAPEETLSRLATAFIHRPRPYVILSQGGIGTVEDALSTLLKHPPGTRRFTPCSVAVSPSLSRIPSSFFHRNCDPVFMKSRRSSQLHRLRGSIVPTKL